MWPRDLKPRPPRDASAGTGGGASTAEEDRYGKGQLLASKGTYTVYLYVHRLHGCLPAGSSIAGGCPLWVSLGLVRTSTHSSEGRRARSACCNGSANPSTKGRPGRNSPLTTIKRRNGGRGGKVGGRTGRKPKVAVLAAAVNFWRQNVICHFLPSGKEFSGLRTALGIATCPAAG